MTLQSLLRRLTPSRETIANNRWLRWLGPSLLHPRLWHLRRRTVALGAAIGVFFAFITPIAQIPLSAAASLLLRANLPAAVIGTLVNTPPTFGPVYYGAWRLGSWVMGEKADPANRPALLQSASDPPAPGGAETAAERSTMQALRDIGKPLLVGALMLAVVGAGLAYGLVSVVWRWRVLARRRARRTG